MTKKIITITGAAGNIAYSLIIRILSGDIFERNTKIQLNLLDITSALPILLGVKLEIEDCAFTQLEDVIITDDPDIAFADSDFVLLVGAKPRSKGMQRADLLLDNASIFQKQAKIINDSNNKPDKVIRTHRREMIIIPQFVGRKFGVYNGREFVDLEILPEMIGLYFGELAPTRTSPTHTGPGVGATKSSKFMPLK